MRSILALGAAALAAIATPANATVIQANVNDINYESGNYYGGIGFNDGVTNFAEIGPAGRFSFNGTVVGSGDPFTALTFCIDIFTAVGSDLYVISSLSTLFSNATKQSQFAALLANVDDVLAAAPDSDARNAAAASLQLALWEIIYEPGTSAYTIAAGTFYTYGDPATNDYFVPLWSTADGYLANIENGIWTGDVSRVNLLVAEVAQSQAYYGPAGIPEPAAWLSMILGFGLAGAALRRKPRALTAPQY